MKKNLPLLLAGLAVLAVAAMAEDAYYDVPLRELTLTEGELPRGGSYDRTALERVPYAVLDGKGEAYLHFQQGAWQSWQGPAFLYDNTSLAICAPPGGEVTGHLYVPRLDGKGMERLAFNVPISRASAEAKDPFYVAKERHYDALVRRRVPGGAWFRHQAQLARKERVGRAEGEPELAIPGRRVRPTELEDTYAVFTGGRAMSENLQLDRLLRPSTSGEPAVDVSSLRGITAQEIDWGPLVKDLQPAKDPLAAMIPSDQHGLFFPSFNAFMTMLDEAKAQGVPVLRLVEPRSEDARTHERYERQLCLSADALSRALGPQVVSAPTLT